jgi:hypothetical protein
MGRRLPEGHITDHRNMRMEEINRRRRRMQASSEGGQGPQGLQRHRWMDGSRPMHVSYYLISKAQISLPLSYVVPSACGIRKTT